MIRKLMLTNLVVSAFALAQAPALEKAPTIKSNHVLSCPAGTRQVGGVKSGMGTLTCLKFAADGLRLFHGPMIALFGNGKVEAVGQMEEGFRVGKWSFFDEAGNKIGETEFLKGDYHGRRVEFTATGALKFEEFWVNGKRQGPQKTFDANGVATITEYRDDRPVQK